MKKSIEKYAFFDKLKALPFIEAIYLFGSRARGDNSPKSDIDLAIVCPTATSDDWRTILEIIEEADTLLEIDCIRLDTEKDLELIQNVQKYQQLLYKNGG